MQDRILDWRKRIATLDTETETFLSTYEDQSAVTDKIQSDEKQITEKIEKEDLVKLRN